MSGFGVISLEAAVVASGLAVLLLGLWAPPEHKHRLGYAAAAALGLIFLGSFAITLPEARAAFGGMYLLDELALFFKRFFLVAGLLVLLLSVEFADRFDAGPAEFYALVLFAVAGMMFAASANDFCLLFVSLELITVTFYVLTSFQRGRARSLEAGVKYLVLGAVASAFLVYGIALVYGGAGTLNFTQLAATATTASPTSGLVSLGLLLVFAGLAFKIAAVPFQVWAPDVYQGAPAPATAFLAVGSKAAGFVLLLRVLHLAAPSVTVHWTKLLAVVAALTILYGNLCAIPQRNLKRLLGYSSIAHAGYLLLGVTAWSADGAAAILYYLSGYLFTMIAAFAVICVGLRGVEDEDLGALAGLHRRSPLLGASLALAMVSLAGVPPLAGFFGKFLLLKSVVARAGAIPGAYVLLGVALVGIVISLYYYFGVIRAIYWLPAAQDVSAIEVRWPMRWLLYACIAGMLWLGIFPSGVVNLAGHAVRVTLRL